MPFERQLKDEIDKTESKSQDTEAKSASNVEIREFSDKLDAPIESPVTVLLEPEPVEEATGLVTGKDLPVSPVFSPLSPKSESATVGMSIAAAEINKAPVAAITPVPIDDLSGADTESEQPLDVLEEAVEFADVAVTKTKKQYSDGQPVVKTETVLLDMAKSTKVVQVSAANTVTTNNLDKPSTDQLPQQLQMTTPVNQKQWGNEFSKRITMLVNNGQQQIAELRLNPAHLGPLSVRLQLDDDQANISFVTNHQAVKEAIELSLPKLKEQLQQQGLDLGNVDVGQPNSDNEEAKNQLTDSNSTDFGDPDSTESDLQSLNEKDIIQTGVSIFV